MFSNKELIEHNERLHKFALRLTNNKANADDLLQSTILRAIEKKHLFKEGTNLYAWMSKIMFNMFASNYRRKVKFESQYDPEGPIERESVKGKQDDRMRVQDVQHAMNDLSGNHREIINMVCVQGKQYNEVSNELDIPVGTVRSRLSRARESLRANMNETPATR